MNVVLSISVDATLEHSTHAQKCEADCTKMCRNEFFLKRYIIKVYIYFETPRKLTGYVDGDSRR